MFIQTWIKIISALVLIVFVGGCAATTATPSGFLTEYGGFRDGEREGVEKIWIPPHMRHLGQLKKQLATYDKIIIETVWVDYTKPDRYDGLKTIELVKFSEKLKQAVSAELQKHYRVVNTVQPGTLRLSMAITEIEVPNQILAATSSVMPVGLAISTMSKLTTGEHTNVGSASLELALSDATTNETLLAIVDRRAGSKDLSTIIDNRSDVSEAFDWWVQRLGEIIKNT